MTYRIGKPVVISFGGSVWFGIVEGIKVARGTKELSYTVSGYDNRCYPEDMRQPTDHERGTYF